MHTRSFGILVCPIHQKNTHSAGKFQLIEQKNKKRQQMDIGDECELESVNFLMSFLFWVHGIEGTVSCTR